MKEQEIISAQQELKHLRTRCGKVYALGNNRFRAVVQTTPVHEYDAATHQWVELSAEKRQQMAAQAQSPIATFADSANSAENAAGILDTYVKEGSTQNFSHDERLWISNTNYYGNRLTYLKVVDLRTWARITSLRPQSCAFAMSTHRRRTPPSCARKCWKTGIRRPSPTRIDRMSAVCIRTIAAY